MLMSITEKDQTDTLLPFLSGRVSETLQFTARANASATMGWLVREREALDSTGRG